jgi:hypothetical protein
LRTRTHAQCCLNLPSSVSLDTYDPGIERYGSAVLAEVAGRLEKLARTGELDKPKIRSYVHMHRNRLLGLLARTLEGRRPAPLVRGTA